ncbi:HlyD family secretion protein [Rheinheimera salexigens]|uniref:Hemolysin D n=1 Tax=Rheinheimera salexigens TaxID=1628148 RepID=A0A1E7Q5G5_9GAMM|nr:HlyD family secretion protein [Rheinheimera salexigens]OEY69405.1 hemolysin D [Rheinheimera salexigens]
MTPDQQFARLVKIASAVFVVLFGYFLFADALMPLTPQAMVTRTITKVAPQISGKVTNIAITNSQAVQTGDILFEIEPTSYQLAVEQARLALEQAQQENAELDAALQAAEAGVKANQTIAEQKHIIAKRLDKLYSTQGVSQQLVDQADSEAATADANLLAAQARLAQLKVHRGTLGENNLKLRQAQNQLEQAKLNLTYTQIKADHNGMVTNLQLVAGSFAKAGQPLIALVSDEIDIVADFREKSLRGISTDTQALIAFDADPGRLYPAYVSTVDAGVSAAQFDANGLLAAPQESDRWVRDAQRIRIHLQLLESPDYSLAAGARVTVQLMPDNKVLRFFARLQIKLISLLHYIY